MKHLIIGTAGHVDHGKTALVRALTGIECDTHREERTRGITINLGFAHLAFADGNTASIVDVPGHRDFIHTMVAGASGIDCAMLVIAADSGVMPQTVEHLQIMQMLGIDKGLVVLSKADLADAEMLELLDAEVADLTAGTFLAGCPVVPVSSVSGAGCDRLLAHLAQLVDSGNPRSHEGPFRMFVDRVFTISGFGSVVTGSVLSGQVQADENVLLLPSAGRSATYRIRRIERHGQQTERAVAGERASINLVGFDRADFKRGMAVCTAQWKPVEMVDVRLQLFANSPPLKRWSQVIFHLGTLETQARIHLLDTDALVSGGKALAQVHLQDAGVIAAGDRFVIRTSSSDVTLGGGMVLDPEPLHHRRCKSKTIHALQRLAGQGTAGLIFETVRKQYRPVTCDVLANCLHLPCARIREAVQTTIPDDIVELRRPSAMMLLPGALYARHAAMVTRRLRAYHDAHFLDPGGCNLQELTGALQIDDTAEGRLYAELLLAHLCETGICKQVGRTWALHAHEPAVDAHMERAIAFVTDFLANCQMQVPLMADLDAAVRARPDLKLDPKRLNDILEHLVDRGVACKVDGNYLHASIVDRCRQQLIAALTESGEGITLAAFRDLVQGNRKICLLLMNLFDAERLTRRVGDRRFLVASR